MSMSSPSFQSRRAAGFDPCYRTSAAQLAGHLGDTADLLRGVAALRRLGPAASGAVRVALALPELKTLAPFWRLWEAMARAEGVDVDALLGELLPLSVVDQARLALWGTTASGSSCVERRAG